METLILRLLLVEDDGSTAQVIKIGMRHLGIPYHLDAAFSAEEAFALWQERPYDILLTDYHLRGSNGVALAAEVHHVNPTVPIIMFTAYDSQVVRREAMEAGVSIYITKPFFVDRFVDTVRTLLDITLRQHTFGGPISPLPTAK